MAGGAIQMAVKFGVNTQTWVGGFAPKDYPLIEKAAKIGFDFIELSYGENETVFDPVIVKQMLEDKGLGVVLCGYIAADRDITSTAPSVRATGIEYFRNAAKTASTIGARLFAGPLYAEIFRGRWLPAEERKAEWNRSVKAMKECAKICGDHGVTIALEPLNRFETDFLNTAYDTARYLEEVDSPHVKVLLDTFHMNMEEKNFAAAIKMVGKHLAHFHANGVDRGTPGADHVPWPEVAGALRAVDYSGGLAIEGFAPYDVGLVNGGKIWRPVAESQDRLASDGLKFLKGLFA
jgi:D-psicose/D-tagatose/L-ribulose 3-epimerase